MKEALLMTNLGFGDAALGPVHQRRDRHLQLLLVVPLPEQLFFQPGHPLLVNCPGRCQVPQVSTLQRHLQCHSLLSDLIANTCD